MDRCNAPTASGRPCRWRQDQCPVASHAHWRERQKGQHGPGQRPGPPAAAATADAVPLPGAVQERDISGVAWWAVEQLATGALEGRDGGTYATLLRVLLACDPDDPAAAAVLAEVELRGRLMHGLPPETMEQWRLLEARFGTDVVNEVRRWAGLFESDPLDIVDPALFRDR